MKINRILFPLDFSDNCLALSSDVEWLAKHYNAQVTLLNVFEVPTSWYGAPLMLTPESFSEYVEAGKERLKHYALALPESQIQRKSLDGNIAWNITHWAKIHDIDLIVMGSHGNGGFPTSLLGSVAIKVLHEAECPVWTHSALIGAGLVMRLGISKIVCSIELSDEAVSLLRLTQDLADELGAKVLLVHCVPEMESRPAKYFDSDLHRFLKNAAEEEIASLQTKAGTNFPVRITEGFIAQDVAEVAVEQSADLIVIGRGVVQETLGIWRTHTCEMIRQAPCPVLSQFGRKEELSPLSLRSTEMAAAPVG